VTETFRGGQPCVEMKAISFMHGHIDLIRAEVHYQGGQKCALSKREVELLRYLMTRQGVPISRNDILTHVWRLNPSQTMTRTIDMHVSFLRRKLRDNSENPSLLITVHGLGYMLARSLLYETKCASRLRLDT